MNYAKKYFVADVSKNKYCEQVGLKEIDRLLAHKRDSLYSHFLNTHFKKVFKFISMIWI